MFWHVALLTEEMMHQDCGVLNTFITFDSTYRKEGEGMDNFIT